MLDAHALLPAVAAQAPVGIAVWDLELRYVAVNEHLAQINGVPAAEHVGRRIPEVLPGLAPVEDTLRGVLASGEPAVGRRVLGRLPGYDAPRWRLASYFPVRDAAGAVVAVAAVISDVTDQVASRARSSRPAGPASASGRSSSRSSPRCPWASRSSGGPSTATPS